MVSETRATAFHASRTLARFPFGRNRSSDETARKIRTLAWTPIAKACRLSQHSPVPLESARKMPSVARAFALCAFPARTEWVEQEGIALIQSGGANSDRKGLSPFAEFVR
ncbi:hypothetical protein B1812_10955 [Methylocystis bryophila]|uniref:Uncharacterized protein n=1 Tax=Methylocystis bryophila TaxID=655015 RepID=A0A1W6MV89_9HYPH|nr:hypothetical protein B1812_10955 [Methylocystis bryophila]